MWRSAGQLQPTHAAGHTSPSTNSATFLKSASSPDPFLSKKTELIPKAVSSAMYTVKPRMMRKTMVSGTIEEGVPSLGWECQRVGMAISGLKRTTHSTTCVATIAFPSKTQNMAAIRATWMAERTVRAVEPEKG